MVGKKVFILMGHPNTDTLTSRLADAYEVGALKAGHEVRRQNVGEMKFDPILHKGYKVIQQLEPDLKTFQENVKWCNHLVILYPNWWGTMPALLKGLIDRAWLPGFAFNFTKTMGFIPGWRGHLGGKSARMIILANTNPIASWLLFGDFTNELARATLKFSGISPLCIKVFSPSETARADVHQRWIRRVERWGSEAR